MFVFGCLLGAPAQSSTPTWQTTNWDGYRIRADHLITARATWEVPTVRWGGRNGYSAQWVGLGGGTNARDRLIQAGTEADDVCTRARRHRCVSSTTQYWAWISIYPGGHQERINNLPVHPGNTVTTSVSWDNHRRRATFTVCNWNVNKCFTATRPSGPPGVGAEIIMERPAINGPRPAALANFAQWHVLGADFVTSHGDRSMTEVPRENVSMTTRHTLATTSALDPTTGAFSVRFHNVN